MSTPLSGGYCGGVPPLPIPNREVKPTCADGTAQQCGRVGSRLLLRSEALKTEYRNVFRAFSCLCGEYSIVLGIYAEGIYVWMRDIFVFVLFLLCVYFVSVYFLCYFQILLVFPPFNFYIIRRFVFYCLC